MSKKKPRSVTIAMAHTPEKNVFDKVKRVYRHKPTKKQIRACSVGIKAISNSNKMNQKAATKAIDFEQFLWDNADAEFYKTLRDQMNLRRAQFLAS